MTAEGQSCGCRPSSPAKTSAAAGAVAAGAASPAFRASLIAGMRDIPGGFLDMGRHARAMRSILTPRGGG